MLRNTMLPPRIYKEAEVKDARRPGYYFWCDHPERCTDCHRDILAMIEDGHLEITQSFMASIDDPSLRAKIVKAVCLRQLGRE